MISGGDPRGCVGIGILFGLVRVNRLKILSLLSIRLDVVGSKYCKQFTVFRLRLVFGKDVKFFTNYSLENFVYIL